MKKPTETEVNIYYGHELYARLNGRQACDCPECEEIRPKIEYLIWKELNGSLEKDSSNGK